MLRLVKISTNTGKVLKVLGINFSNDAQVVDFASNVLGLPVPDLDQPLWWGEKGADTAITIERQNDRQLFSPPM